MNVSRETFHTCVFIPPLCNAGCWRRGGAISPREEEGGTFDGQEVLADTDDKNSDRENVYYYAYYTKIENAVKWSTFRSWMVQTSGSHSDTKNACQLGIKDHQAFTYAFEHLRSQNIKRLNLRSQRDIKYVNGLTLHAREIVSRNHYGDAVVYQLDCGLCPAEAR